MQKQKLFILMAIILLGGLTTAFIRLPRTYFMPKPAWSPSGKEKMPQAAGVYAPDYQQKVIRILETQRPGDFRYFFREEAKTYMLVNLRNTTQWFETLILVEKWDKLNGMRQTNGVWYPEELYELEWKIEERNEKREILYLDVFPIID